MEKMNTNNHEFNFFSSRLTFIEATGDQQLNIELWHCLNVFESHVYGAFLQYNRIKSDLDFRDIEIQNKVPISQASLDIYYYTLTWDKLQKIYEKLKYIVNKISLAETPIPDTFIPEFRIWKHRIDHLFSEFDGDIRNEYEHPSFKFYSKGNIIMWGNISTDDAGNIKAHVGNDWFVTIKREHYIRIQVLRTDLFGLFIKHFTQKPLTEELIKLKKYIEDNIVSISKELKELREKDNINGFNSLLHKFTMYEMSLSKEGMHLSDDIKNKVYSLLTPYI